MMIEVHKFLSILNHQLIRIINKINNGIDLSDDQRDLIKELYICYKQYNLETLKKYLKMENNKNKSFNLDQRVLTLDGKPIPASNNQDDYWTVKKVILFAIDNSAETEKKTAKQKYEIYKLAERIANDDTNLNHEEWAIIKDAVGNTFKPSIIGFVWDIIEGKK